MFKRSKKYSKLVTLTSTMVLGLSGVVAPVLAGANGFEIQAVQAADTTEGLLDAAFPATKSATRSDITKNFAQDAIAPLMTDKGAAKIVDHATASASKLVTFLSTSFSNDSLLKDADYAIKIAGTKVTGATAEAVAAQLATLANGDTFSVQVTALTHGSNKEITSKTTVVTVGEVSVPVVKRTNLSVAADSAAVGAAVSTYENASQLAPTILNVDGNQPFSAADIANVGSSVYYRIVAGIDTSYKTLSELASSANASSIVDANSNFANNGVMTQLIPVPYTDYVRAHYNFAYYLNGTTVVAGDPAKATGVKIALVPRTITVGTIADNQKPVFTYTIDGVNKKVYTDGAVLEASDLNPIDSAGLTYMVGEGTTAKLLAAINTSKTLSHRLYAFQTADTTLSAIAPNQFLAEDAAGVNFSKAGTYYVPVSVTNGSNGVTTTIKLPVTITADKSAPVFSLATGTVQDPSVVQSDDAYNIMTGVIAKDNGNSSAGEITPAVSVKDEAGKTVEVTKGTISIKTAGKYTVTYTALNAAGKTATYTRVITVTEKETTPSIEWTEEALATTGRVNYIPGYGTRIYSKPGSGATDRFLAHGTNWKVWAKATVEADGSVWYNVGKNQWVRATYLDLAGEDAIVSELTGVASINYIPGYGINLWNGYGENAKFSGRRLAHNSNWKVFKKASVNDGTVWYNLGGNQWILAEYAVIK